MSASRPEVVDAAGTRHRHGCPMPPPAPGAPVAGIRIARCPSCGAVRLIPRETR